MVCVVVGQLSGILRNQWCFVGVVGWKGWSYSYKDGGLLVRVDVREVCTILSIVYSILHRKGLTE